MKLTEVKVGNFVYLNFPDDRKEVYIIRELNRLQDQVILTPFYEGEERMFNINDQNWWNMIEGIPFEKKFLKQMKFENDQSYEIPKIAKENIYVKFIVNENDIIVKEEHEYFTLVLCNKNKEKGDEYKLLPISYFHEFQNNVSPNMDYSSIRF